MWTVLYASMSVASWMVFKKGGWQAQVPYFGCIAELCKHKPVQTLMLGTAECDLRIA